MSHHNTFKRRETNPGNHDPSCSHPVMVPQALWGCGATGVTALRHMPYFALDHAGESWVLTSIRKPRTAAFGSLVARTNLQERRQAEAEAFQPALQERRQPEAVQALARQNIKPHITLQHKDELTKTPHSTALQERRQAEAEAEAARAADAAKAAAAAARAEAEGQARQAEQQRQAAAAAAAAAAASTTPATTAQPPAAAVSTAAPLMSVSSEKV
eukprot:365633-Chlamydomonas_euryale.AAC.3